MNTPTMSTWTIAAALFITSMAGTSTAAADVPGYWTSQSGEILRNGFGQCWRTTDWKAEYGIAECGDIADADSDGIADDADTCPNTPAKSKVNSQGCELDSDNDGVVDSKDNCSGTIAGTNVDASGCKLPAKDSDGDGIVDAQDRCPNSSADVTVSASGCELDNDKDGVANSQDNCPNTAANTRVNATGCALDSDHDGIVDSQDRCPGTAHSAKVDANGCKLEENIVLKDVNFKTNSDALTATSYAELHEVAKTLKRYPSMKVEVAGYTDSLGAISYNRMLSQKRAAAVVSQLIKNGVSAANLTAIGYGPDSPIADNSSRAGRAENRRVELHIIQR